MFKISPYWIAISLLFAQHLHAESKIRITNGEWEPYLSEFAYEYGMASHIVSEAFKREGIEVEWGFMPWVRAWEDAKSAIEWDASAVWWPTNDARKHFLISDPVVNTSNVFFHLKEYQFDWNTVNDLNGLTIGITRGYDYGEELMAYIASKKLNISTVTTDEQNF